jgi:hypothetical protein
LILLLLNHPDTIVSFLITTFYPNHQHRRKLNIAVFNTMTYRFLKEFGDERAGAPPLKGLARLPPISTEGYPMPPYFQLDMEMDPFTVGLRQSYGCGVHSKYPERCTRAEKEQHKQFCLNKKIKNANLKEISHRQVMCLNVTDRTARRRGHSNNTKKPIKKVHFVMYSDEHVDMPKGSPSCVNSDLFFERTRAATEGNASRPQFFRREVTEVLYICPPGDSCLCYSTDLFKSQKEHDGFVAKNRYRCGDRLCSCRTVRLVRNNAEHDLSPRWTCTALLKTSNFSMNQMTAYCPCFQIKPTFHNRDDHNRHVLNFLASKKVVKRGVPVVPAWNSFFMPFLEPWNTLREKWLEEWIAMVKVKIEMKRGMEIRKQWTPKSPHEMMCMNPKCTCYIKQPSLVFLSPENHQDAIARAKFYCTLSGCPCQEKIYSCKAKHEEMLKEYFVLDTLVPRMGYVW